MKTYRVFIFVALYLLMCSCSSAPIAPTHADTYQIKAWVLMENISEDYQSQLNKDFINKILEQPTIPALSDTNKTLKLVGKQDSYMVNPWRSMLTSYLENCRDALYRWELDPNHIKRVGGYGWMFDYRTGDHFLPHTMEYAYEKAYREQKRGQVGYLKESNYDIIDIYVSQNKQIANEVHEYVCNEYINYIFNHANSVVTMKEWEIDLLSTTDSYRGYHITYEIGTGFYVLISYLELNSGNEFQVRQIYSGNSLIDLGRAKSGDL